MPVCSIYSLEDDRNSSQEFLKGTKLEKKAKFFWVADSSECGERITPRLYGMGVSSDMITAANLCGYRSLWCLGENINWNRKLSHRHWQFIRRGSGQKSRIILIFLRNSCWFRQACGGGALHMSHAYISQERSFVTLTLLGTDVLGLFPILLLPFGFSVFGWQERNLMWSSAVVTHSPKCSTFSRLRCFSDHYGCKEWLLALL